MKRKMRRSGEKKVCHLFIGIMQPVDFVLFTCMNTSIKKRKNVNKRGDLYLPEIQC